MNASAPMDRDGAVKSVERSIDLVLELIAGPMTLTEISQRTKLSKSTARRLLRSLGHGGMVVYDPLSRKYLLGPGCLRLGQGFVNGKGGFGAFAREPLRELWRSTGETVAVHVRLGRHRVCVDELPSAQQVRYVSGAGMMAPVHVGSAGRVLLAWLPEADVTALLEGVVLTPMTRDEAVDLDTYRKQLESVRRLGYAVSLEERVRGAAAVSVPVFDQEGTVLASLSVLGPLERFTEEKRLQAVEDLNRAAAAIQASLHRLDPARGPSELPF